MALGAKAAAARSGGKGASIPGRGLGMD